MIYFKQKLLNENDLKSMDIPLGPRKIILHEIAKISDCTNTSQLSDFNSPLASSSIIDNIEIVTETLEKFQFDEDSSSKNENCDFDDLENLDETIDYIIQNNRKTLVWNNFYYYFHSLKSSKFCKLI